MTQHEFAGPSILHLKVKASYSQARSQANDYNMLPYEKSYILNDAFCEKGYKAWAGAKVDARNRKRNLLRKCKALFAIEL